MPWDAEDFVDGRPPIKLHHVKREDVGEIINISGSPITLGGVEIPQRRGRETVFEREFATELPVVFGDRRVGMYPTVSVREEKKDVVRGWKKGTIVVVERADEASLIEQLNDQVDILIGGRYLWKRRPSDFDEEGKPRWCGIA